MGLNTYNREDYDFIDLVKEHLDIELKAKRRYQKCPACGGRTSFIVNENNTYKCQKPHCDLNKGGDLISFFKWAGHSFAETCRLLNIKVNHQEVYHTARSFKLEQAFRASKDLLKATPLALDYLNQRYQLTLEDLNRLSFEIGFTNGLPDWGFTLGEPRILFPVRDLDGTLVHLHSRAMNADSNLRWKATETGTHDKPFSAYTWNSHLYLKNKELFLTEGISDGLILTKLGLPTASILSLTNPLTDLIPKFANLTNLTVIFDNDRVPLNVAGRVQYKSWDMVNSSGLTLLERLLLVAIANPKLNIWCVMPPDRVGIKDVNDWILTCKHTKESFLQELGSQAKLITDFAIDHYWNDPSKHKLIIKSIKTKPSEALFLSKIVVDYKDWFDYIRSII